MKSQINKAIEIVKKKKHIAAKERSVASKYVTHMMKQYEGTLKLNLSKKEDKL